MYPLFLLFCVFAVVLSPLLLDAACTALEAHRQHKEFGRLGAS